MSYFATIAGVDLEGMSLEGLRFVPLGQTHAYLQGHAEEIEKLDGIPAYLCEANVWGTSHDIITEILRIAEQKGDVLASRAGAILKLCERTGAIFRSWEAPEEPGWFSDVRAVATLDEVIAPLLAEDYPVLWDIRFVPASSSQL